MYEFVCNSCAEQGFDAESFSADSLSEDEKILLRNLRDKRTNISRKYRDALIEFQEKSGKKGGGDFSADVSPKNSIEWGIHDNPSELARLIGADNLSEYPELLEEPHFSLSQMQVTEHPDGIIFPCTHCDDFAGTPEYCAGAKWSFDNGLEGFYTFCDEELQRGIDERTKELHEDIASGNGWSIPYDPAAWIRAVEPANWPRFERHYALSQVWATDTGNP